MKSVDGVVVHEIVISKSRFITTICPVSCVAEGNEFIASLKLKYYDATHNCSAMRFGDSFYLDDDGEPSRTAAFPMYNVIEKQGVDNVCVVVTRYFGGIKLGAGGLVRAYSSAVSEALLTADLVDLVGGFKCKVCVDIALFSRVIYLFESCGVGVMSREFLGSDVVVCFEVLEDDFDSVKLELNGISYLLEVEVLENIFMKVRC